MITEISVKKINKISKKIKNWQRQLKEKFKLIRSWLKNIKSNKINKLQWKLRRKIKKIYKKIYKKVNLKLMRVVVVVVIIKIKKMT